MFQGGWCPIIYGVINLAVTELSIDPSLWARPIRGTNWFLSSSTIKSLIGIICVETKEKLILSFLGWITVCIISTHSSNYLGLRTSAVSMTSTASITSVQWSNDLDSLNSSKHLLILMFGSFLAPKWPMPVPLCGMDHQNSIFSLISDSFLLEAVLRPADFTFSQNDHCNSNFQSPWTRYGPWLIKINDPSTLHSHLL